MVHKLRNLCKRKSEKCTLVGPETDKSESSPTSKFTVPNISYSSYKTTGSFPVPGTFLLNLGFF